MKKTVALLLVFASLIILACPAYGAMPSAAVPLYTDAQTANVSLVISSTGLAEAKVIVMGKETLEETTVIIYLEKLVDSKWTRVDIETSSDVWEYTSADTSFSKSFYHQLTSGGEYRAVADFYLTGSSAESFIKTDKATY